MFDCLLFLLGFSLVLFCFAVGLLVCVWSVFVSFWFRFWHVCVFHCLLICSFLCLFVCLFGFSFFFLLLLLAEVSLPTRLAKSTKTHFFNKKLVKFVYKKLPELSIYPFERSVRLQIDSIDGCTSRLLLLKTRL